MLTYKANIPFQSALACYLLIITLTLTPIGVGVGVTLGKESEA